MWKSLLVSALMCGISLPNATGQPASPVVSVMVQAMVTKPTEGRFVEVDTSRDEAAKEIEAALRKIAPQLLPKKVKPGVVVKTDVILIVGVESQRIVPGSEIRPDLGLRADLIACKIVTKTMVFTGLEKPEPHPEPYVRDHSSGGVDCKSAAKHIAEDLVAWIDANRTYF